MLKFSLLFILLTCLQLTVHAQQSSVKGTVLDTSNKENLHNAVVSVIRQKDSILVKYARTDTKGNFEIKNIPAGKYTVMISYPLYADFAEKIELTANATKDFGAQPLIQKAKLLEEVIVRQKIAAIRINGDTTEYRADSFKVGANANVADLLKKMPGIQVNSKGEITTQGEKVEKILVDGEEFFSDDPAVVTQTLRADAVKTVQVFDKKSDQATFSGIDDGQKTKTINLQLKEDKKKGYFGKMEAGSDFDYYKNAKIMANSFKGKRKIAGYVTYDNTQFNSLDWNDRNNYGGNMNSNTEFSDDGGIYFTNEGDDFSYGQGLPSAVTAGLLYSKKWNADKQNINNFYQYNNLTVNGLTKRITQNILDSGSFTNTRQDEFTSKKYRNKIKSIYDLTIDSMSSLKLTVTGAILHTDNSGYSTGSSTTDLTGFFRNKSNKFSSTVTDNKNLATNIFYRKRFKKKGRTISLNADLIWGDNKSNGYLLAGNEFFDSQGVFSRKDSINQFKPNEDVTSTFNGRASYTEPLWKNTFLELNYAYAGNKNDASRITFSKAITGKYEQLVDSLSNHYIYNNSSNTGGFNVRYAGKKINFSVGTSLGGVTYKLTDVMTKAARDINFTNVLPTFNFGYTPGKQKRLNFSYRGNTRNPSLQQIQPLRDNSDGLNATIGNPDLQQEFRNNFSLYYNDYKVLKSRSIYISANFATVNNAISNSNTFDDSGRVVTQPVNVDGNYNGNMYAQYRFDIVTALNFGFGISPSISRNVNQITRKGVTTRNVSDNRRMGYNISMNYYPDKWINFYFQANANQNETKSSINPGIITKYWTYSSSGEVEMKLPKKWYVTLEEDITVYEKTAAFANATDIFILNANIKKSITKDETWQVKLSANDLLNQKQAINRNISSNIISETTNQTIQRVFLLSLIYNFSKNGKPQNN